MEDTEVVTLGKQVEKHLNGWKFGDDGEAMSGSRNFFYSGEMKFSFNRDWQKKDRININTWSWPTYTRLISERYRHGEPEVVRMNPRDLYDPQEGSPSISVAISKGAERIAADIKRRFLPDYGRIWDRLTVKARENQESADKARADWVAICKAIGKTPNDSTHYVEYNGASSSMAIQNRNGSAHIEMTCSADEFARIMAALKKA